jgi:hypothetical protein
VLAICPPMDARGDTEAVTGGLFFPYSFCPADDSDAAHYAALANGGSYHREAHLVWFVKENLDVTSKMSKEY